jgi:hypothetical protein
MDAIGQQSFGRGGDPVEGVGDAQQCGDLRRARRSEHGLAAAGLQHAAVVEHDEAMTKAESIIGTAARASAWAKIDEELVEDAAAIPFDWDKQANIEGSQVNGVGDLWNIGAWDYTWTSFKVADGQFGGCPTCRRFPSGSSMQMDRTPPPLVSIGLDLIPASFVRRRKASRSATSNVCSDVPGSPAPAITYTHAVSVSRQAASSALGIRSGGRPKSRSYQVTAASRSETWMPPKMCSKVTGRTLPRACAHTLPAATCPITASRGFMICSSSC